MKITVFLASLALSYSTDVYAQSKLEYLECQSDRLNLTQPTNAEQKAKRDNLKRSPNLFVDEFLWQERQKELKASDWPVTVNKKPYEVTWEEAKKLILRGVVTHIMQNHDRSVYLITNRGSHFVTKQPTIDNIYLVVSSVDPCHLYIHVLTE
ncbi:hypothetical protein [Undibacterium sp. Ji22W]|uniref:hypothetical protein n=1 Tax=Undibacterium sp. Ji22W TaxID=3413038 RepID=UPI003BF29F89